MAGESQARIGIYGDDKATPTIKSVQGSLQNLAKDAKSSILTGVGLGSGVAAFNLLSNAAHSAVAYLGDAVSAASDLGETTSKVNIVFGDAADAVLRMGETSAEALGMSENAALAAAGVYGNLFRAMGITEQASADMSTNLVQLAADLASFNNMDPTEVLDKLRAGLSGETEPLRTLGVNINDAILRQKAFDMGLTKSTTQVLPAAIKAQAAYALIFEQTALAQGDFERTSDSLANQLRTLEANLDDVSTAVGEALLPFIVDTVQAINDLITVMDALGAKAAGTAPEVGGLGDAISHIVFPAQFLLEGLGAAEEGLHSFAEEIRATSGQVGAAVPLMKGAAEDFADAVPDALAEARAEARKIVRLTLQDLAAELVAGQTDWQKAWDDYGQIMEDDLTEAQEIAQLKGMLTGQALADGLNSTDPERAAAAEAMKATIETRLLELQYNAPQIARATGQSLAAALASTAPAQYQAALKLAEQIRAGVRVDLTAAGTSVALSWARGLASMAALSAARHAAALLASEAKELLMGRSPPPEGPLKDIDTGAENVGMAWAEGLTKGMAGFQFPTLPGLTGAPSGGLATAGAAMGGGGGEIHTHVYLDGREIAEAVSRHQYYQSPGGPARLPR